MNLFFCNKNAPQVSYYAKVDDIPKQVFNELDCCNHLYFSPGYLSALELNHENIQFSYMVLLDQHSKAIGLAIIQLVDFYLDSVQETMESLFHWLRCIGRKAGLLSPEKPFKILTCGNTFVSGEHGIYIRPDQDKKTVINQSVAGLLHFVETVPNLKSEVDAFMVKDFAEETLASTDDLEDEGFYSFQVDPNMVMTLRPDWQDFDDYLAAMRTKFRVKAKKALEKSATLRVEALTAARMEALEPQLTQLYKSVASNASFNLGDFSLGAYVHLLNNLGNRYFVNAYWQESQLVGFASGMITDDSVDAHFVGIDYEVNRTYAVYQRMLYDYISMAIAHKARYLVLGRTASEIKSSVGAEPRDMTIYLRHKKTIPNKILSLFLRKIEPTAFVQKHPFKAVVPKK